MGQDGSGPLPTILLHWRRLETFGQLQRQSQKSEVFMRTQTWRTAAVWAIGTCALVLAVTWPQRLNAVDQTVRDAKRVDKPQMLAGGIEYTWQASDSWCVVRGQPVKFTINATNPTSQSVQAKLTAMLEASSVSSLISRVPTVPKIIWQNDQSVALCPEHQPALFSPPRLCHQIAT